MTLLAFPLHQSAMVWGSCKSRIGLLDPKSPENVASVLRAAANSRANSVYYTGTRYPRMARYNPCTVDM
ncbi:MAG: hypothetical protein LJE83_06320 [Gammaproteobacteria bacterium]|nr:hypothetical protein [Gammaproteobacteria bacterium]